MSETFICSYCEAELAIAGHLERQWERHICARCFKEEAKHMGARERVLYALRRHKVAMVPLEAQTEL